MNCRGSLLALTALAGGILLAPPGWAQKRAGGAAREQSRPSGEKNPDGGKTPIDQFATMTPAEQQKALARLPAGERKKLQARIEQFNRLPAEQQRVLKNLYNRLHQLPADRQNAVRKAINKFSAQPIGRQDAIREELRSQAAMPEQERLARSASPDFRKSFNGPERDLVREMSVLLPPH
jgi:Protein of unknown function (DUF3106)